MLLLYHLVILPITRLEVSNMTQNRELKLKYFNFHRYVQKSRFVYGPDALLILRLVKNRLVGNIENEATKKVY